MAIATHSVPPLFRLPDELIELIVGSLQNRDIKNVRLANRRLEANSLLRFDRVFISPNPTNLDVLHRILEHTEFRRQVKEIIWDDAALRFWNQHGADDVVDERTLGAWLHRAHHGQRDLKKRRQIHSDPMSDLESLDYYRRLYREQQAIMSSGLDAEALRYALETLPALERVIISSATCEPYLDLPRYQTPMIRAIPPTCIFEQPRGWPTDYQLHDDVVNDTWTEIREDWDWSWHGVEVVLQELARTMRPVPELVVDCGNESTGIPFQFFEDSTNISMNHLETICRRGIRRLELSIHVPFSAAEEGLERLAQSRLIPVLRTASSLQSFSLRTCNVEVWDYEVGSNLLKSLPVHSWPALRHLSLARLPIERKGFVEFLNMLPPAIRSLEFVGLIQDGDERSWREILHDMKHKLCWTAKRPQVTLAFDEFSFKVWCTEAIARYFANEGINPVREGKDEFELGVGAWAKHELHEAEKDFEWGCVK